MTLKERKFCEAYVQNGSLIDSCRIAGYTEQVAQKRAYEIITRPHIIKYINELRKETYTSAIMSAKERQEFLSKVIKNNDYKIHERLKALDLLNKMTGEYIEKVELSGTVEQKNVFEQLTLEELKSLAKEE